MSLLQKLIGESSDDCGTTAAGMPSEGKQQRSQRKSIDALKPHLRYQQREQLDQSATLDGRERTYEAVKRVKDVVVAVTALVLISPVLAILAILIKLTDFGPVFFVQTRVGRHGREFRCYKLRSMIPDADRRKHELTDSNRHADHRTFKMEADPRVTWIGAFLRKTSLDEVPQLWNVVKGDMSIVGPRPPVPAEVTRYSVLDHRRLEVRPGLTCFWQVSGRANVPFDRQVELDIHYIENRSLWLDLKLIVRTIPAVLSGRGAY